MEINKSSNHLPSLKAPNIKFSDFKGGMALSHSRLDVRQQYVDLQKKWHKTWAKRYPNQSECATPDEFLDKQITHKYETFGCFKTNISEADVWYMVDCILYQEETDQDIITANRNYDAYNETQRALYYDD